MFWGASSRFCTRDRGGIADFKPLGLEIRVPSGCVGGRNGIEFHDQRLIQVKLMAK
jgi:hypothetical protein